MAKIYKINGVNIDTKLGWDINGFWHPNDAIKSWNPEQLADAGIVVEEVQEPTPVELTPEQILTNASEEVRFSLQNAIDEKARSFGFSSGNALMLYAGFTNPFQPLAQTFATWEATVWVEAGQYRDEVIAGTKPMLTGAEAVALMPEYLNE